MFPLLPTPTPSSTGTLQQGNPKAGLSLTPHAPCLFRNVSRLHPANSRSCPPKRTSSRLSSWLSPSPSASLSRVPSSPSVTIPASPTPPSPPNPPPLPLSLLHHPPSPNWDDIIIDSGTLSQSSPKPSHPTTTTTGPSSPSKSPDATPTAAPSPPAPTMPSLPRHLPRLGLPIQDVGWWVPHQGGQMDFCPAWRPFPKCKDVPRQPQHR